LRDGHEPELPVAELVPGEYRPAQCRGLGAAAARLLNTKDLHVRESALTGGL